MLLLRGAVLAALTSAAAAFSAAITPATPLPAAKLHSGFPPDFVDIAEYAADKNLIIVGLPGAVRFSMVL